MRRFLLRRPTAVARPRLQLVGLEDRSVPASFTVDSLSEAAVAGKVTLRETLATCAANGEDDSIQLDASLSGASVTLTGGQMTLGEANKSLEITFGDLTPPRLDANQLSRVFSVPANATVSVNRMTLINGKADKGGLIFNAGKLTLGGMILSGGVAETGGGGAIYTETGSTLTVSGSTLVDNTSDGNGGAILDFGSTLLTVSGSLVDSNVAAGSGGGIIGGNVTLVQATVSRNVAAGDGGGVWYNGTLTSVNSTVVGNYADSGAAGGKSGGGLFQGGAVEATLTNTLVAGNRVGATTNPAAAFSDLNGAVAAASSYNLISDAATAGGLTNGTNNNLVGVAGAGVRPLAEIVEAVPAENGAPGQPRTLALKTGSVALNAGKEALAVFPGSFALANDARTFPFLRKVGTETDIGAFEAQNVKPIITPPTNKITILEDSTAGFTFSGAGNVPTVSDPLAVTPSYTVTLTGLKGKVTLGSTTGLTNLTGNGSALVSFKATTVAQVNAALAGAKFVGDADAFGGGGYSLKVNDGDATAPGGAQETELPVGLTITPVIDPPTVTSPTTAKNTPVDVKLSRAAVDGPEVNYFKVTNLTGGTLTYVGPQSATPVTVTNGAVLRFAGRFVDLTANADTVFTFTPTAGFEGTASFDVQVAQGTYGEPVPPATNPDPVFGGPVITARIGVGADTTAPTAKLGTAAQATTGATTKYDFTVTYSDDRAVTAASLAGTNVRVTGPNGFSQVATFVSATPTGDAASLTATYRLTGTGTAGVFPTTAAAGTYTIAVLAGQVKDAAGNAVAAADLGTFTVVAGTVVDTTIPQSDPGPAPDVTTLGATFYEFTVTYTDNVAISGVTINDTNVRVFAPNGFTTFAKLVSAAPTGDAAKVVATYRFTPEGGAFSAANVGFYNLSLQNNSVKDTSGNFAIGGALGNFALIAPVPATKPLLVGFKQYAVGTDRGGDGSVRLFNADGTSRLVDPLKPFGSFTGGVRTASADFTGDGVADIVAGTGPGRATQVQLIDGATLAVLTTINPFEASFVGGVYVAAGDVTGDGVPDIVITPDEGGGPRVSIYNGRTFAIAADFFGIEDKNFRGGARAAVGDMNGDGTGDVVVAAGFGGGPRMAMFNGKSVADTTTWQDSATLGGKIPQRLGNDFFAFEETLRNGAFVTVGDVDGDGKADLVAGGGPGGGPRVLVYAGAGLLANNRGLLADFFAGDQASRGGVRLTVKDLDNDGRADLATGSGTGAGSKVVTYTGGAIAVAPNSPAALVSADAVPGFTGGVFVG